MKLFPLFLSNKVTRLLFCFYLAASLISCAHSSMRPKHKAQLKAVYIKQYKLTYLRAILKKSYNNSPAINEIIASDHSGFTEPVLTEEDYKLIDSIATADNEALKIDSAEGSHRAEGSQGKRPLEFIMKKMKENKLEKIARKRMKHASLY